MIIKSKISLIRELENLPGVGERVAQELWNMGIKSIKDLRNKNPEELYLMHQVKRAGQSDITMLYIFRCAVYFASHCEHDTELLKWWNWKDTKGKGSSSQLAPRW